MPRIKIGMTFDASNPAAIAWAKQHAAELVSGISETTRDRILDEVVDAFESDTSMGDLVDAIENIVGDSDRAQLIADTESMTAANEGQRQSWDQAVDAGLLDGTEKREWIVTGDSDVCDECDELDGTVVELDEEFPNDGGDGPPLHPRCRCTEGIVNG